MSKYSPKIVISPLSCSRLNADPYIFDEIVIAMDFSHHFEYRTPTIIEKISGLFSSVLYMY